MKHYGLFKPIKTFDPSEFIGVVEYFIDEKNKNVELLRKIEDKHLLLQTEFDASHPNITFMIGNFEIDKENNTIDNLFNPFTSKHFL